MSRYSLYLSTIILGLSLVGCKPDGQTTTATETSSKSFFSKKDDIPKGIRIIKNMPEKYTTEQIISMNRAAQRILEYRNKEKGRKYWDVLCTGPWEYQYIFGGIEKTKPDELNGRWIEFKENMTYQYGYYEEIQGEGTYHYDLASAELLLVDKNETIKPTEYIVQMYANIAILKGTDAYYDNNYQCKIKGVGFIPKKPI